MVCAVPKSGSSSWHRLFWSIERKRLNLSQNQRLYTSEDTKGHVEKAKNMDPEEWNNLVASKKGDDDFNRYPPKNASFRVILVSS